MSNKVSVGAELSPGLYRIFNPEIKNLQAYHTYVAKSGYEIGTPVTLSLYQPTDLNDLVSFSLCGRLIDKTGAHM